MLLNCNWRMCDLAVPHKLCGVSFCKDLRCNEVLHGYAMKLNVHALSHDRSLRATLSKVCSCVPKRRHALAAMRYRSQINKYWLGHGPY